MASVLDEITTTEHISHHLYLSRIQIDTVNTEFELTIFKSYLHLGIVIAFAWFDSCHTVVY